MHARITKKIEDVPNKAALQIAFRECFMDLTTRLTDAAPVMPEMKQQRNRGVRVQPFC